MIEINSQLARTWSRMGPRAVYGQILSELARANPRLLALSADLGRSSGLGGFAKEFPDRYFNVGIAEQNLIGISAGLARMEFNVFSSTFAPFAALRAGDHVRMNMGYMQEPVNLVGLAGGFALGLLGNSHFGIEDVAVMRAIPGITVISPADCVELYKSLRAIEYFEKPVYLRLTGGVGMPIVYEDDYQYRIGQAIVLAPVSNITVMTHGVTSGHALRAVSQLNNSGHQVGLLNVHTIKPLDEDAISRAIKASDHIIVIEEHSIIGGLGSAIIEFAQENGLQANAKIHRYGLSDFFPKTGNYDYMLRSLGLDSDGIKKTIERFL